MKNNLPNGRITMSINTGKVERSDGEQGKKIIRGYAVSFNDVYTYTDYWSNETWTERVDKNAFDGVDLSNVLILCDHSYERVLGRVGKNLRIEVDENGLFFEVQLLDGDELSDYIYKRVEYGIIDACSFGFTIKDLKRDLGNKTEIITKIGNLYEVTLTSVPAYRGTVAITMKSNIPTMCENRQEFLAEESKRRESAAALESERNRILKKLGVECK